MQVMVLRVLLTGLGKAQVRALNERSRSARG